MAKPAPRLLVPLLLMLLALGGPPAGAECHPTDLPAATLLFPYFEVDLDGGATTLLAIGATPELPAGSFGVLARVTLWTDYAIPTASFDLYLRQGAVQTINLRDILTTGQAPVTQPPAGRFPGCPATLGGSLGSASTLRLKHTGMPVGELCFGNRILPSLAHGYVTVDVVSRCSPASMNPTVRDYFQGLSPVASMANLLWGDFTFVDPERFLASSQNAVHIQADPSAFEPGDYTFYGRYVDFNGADRRAPLPSRWIARYAIGEPFDDTRLLVWRDNRARIASPARCGNRPAWWPLTHQLVRSRDERASRVQTPELIPANVMPFATQVLLVTSWSGPVEVGTPNRIVPEPTFGTLEIRLDHLDNTAAQGWIGWTARADGRFSVGLSAAPVRDSCNAGP